MPPKSYHLPEKCWERIFKFLHDDHHRYLESPSLVSKQFLSITNSLRSSLTLCDQTLLCVLHRFPNLTSIDIRHCQHCNLDTLLAEISRSPLQLKSLNLSNRQTLPSNGLRAFAKNMKTLKSLICSRRGLITADVFLISRCFPFLEELDLSFPQDNSYCINRRDNFNCALNDFGLKALSFRLPKLKKINLSGNYFFSDESLFYLCKNCEFLQEVVIFYCYRITHNGIALAICERPSLSSLSVRITSADFTSKFIESLVNLKGLTCLDLSSSSISDELLYSIAEKCLPLRKLVFQDCSGYTYAAMFCLLSKCQLLEHLDLQNAEYILNDRRINKLSQILRRLFYINLNGTSMITKSSLFALLRNCRFINEIRMESTGIGRKDFVEDEMDYFVNTQVKSLYLAHNISLADERIKIFASMCPNLRLLDLTGCSISTEGVKKVVENCTQLREINLRNCPGVDDNIVDWMISSRPSLLKVTAPRSTSQCSYSLEELPVISYK